MVIELSSANIITSIKATSHREVAEIADADAKYRAEAGTEKQQEINRCIVEAVGRLQRRCIPFLTESFIGYRNDDLPLPETFKFEFDFSERRAVGKADALSPVMHSFVVELALSKFYSNVSQVELSNKHSLLAVEAGKELSLLLYHKNPPRV